MPTTDTNLTSLVINKLTKAQYAAATKNPNELYITTDVPGVYLGSIPASISADGNYPLMRVGLADNIYSPSGNPAPDQTFIYRSTGGDSDVSDGYAELERLVSTITPCTTIKESVVATPGGTVTTVTVNESTFKTAVSDTAGTYNFSYNGTSWVLNGSNVTLNSYGITITAGSVSANSTIKVVYTKESIGTITIANPVSLFSVGMNQFDKNGNQIFDGYGIAVSGDIIATSGHKVIYFRVLGGNQYTIYNSNDNAVVRYGFIATEPTTSSVLVNTTSSSDPNVNHFTPTINGYICVDTTDITNLCCHLTWSGYNDEVYEDYFYDELIIPYEDAEGTIISDYGLITLDSVYYDEIDLRNKVFYKRTTRIAYSTANLATVKAMGVPYIYDSNYIYYGVDTVTYNLNSSINMAYRVSDFGTEEFTDTKVALTCDILYQENLRDKIRRLNVEDLQLISNKVNDWTLDPSDDRYPSEKLVKESLNTKANVNGNYPEMIVGLANNLVSPDGLSQDDQHFIYRSTGGSADVSDGYANIGRIHGDETTTSNIDESYTITTNASGISNVTVNSTTWKSVVTSGGTYNFDYYADMSINKSANINVGINKDTFIASISDTAGIYEFTYAIDMTSSKTGSFTMTLDKDQFIVGVSGVTGTYVFTYDSSAAEGEGSWTLDSNEISLSTYGIETTGTVANGNTITVNYIDNYWTYNGLEVDLSDYGITVTGTPAVDNYIYVTYSSIGWRLNETTSVSSLSTYGITYSGTPKADDKFTVVYVKARSGVVTNSNPTSFFSVGMNQFNKNGSRILSGYTVDSSGNVVTQSGQYVIWFKALGDNQYTIYNSNNNAIKRIAFYSVEPSTDTTGMTVSSSAIAQNVNYYTPAMNGYIVVATTNINDLCCHLTWSGYNDEVYEDYFDYTIDIPYTDKNGNVISSWGLPYLSSTYYDEIDFDNKRYYKRVQREEYDATAYAAITTTKVHDDQYMFYGIPEEVYELNSGVSGNYRMSDFGTEEFIGTYLDVYCNLTYQDNLRDRLRRLAEDPRSNETKLTTANWVNNHEATLATNCILEKPRIKYTIDSNNNFILQEFTYYIPNGYDSNNNPIYEEHTFSGTSTYAAGNYQALFFRSTLGGVAVTKSRCSSGDTAPTSPVNGDIWFDTANNLVKYYSGGWNSGYSLPLGILNKSHTSSQPLQEFEPFEGMGYVGKSLFCLPNVKVLIPNGRNTDGSLNNTIFLTPKVKVNTFDSDKSGTFVISTSNIDIYTDTNYNQELSFNQNSSGANQYVAHIGNVTMSSGIQDFEPKKVFRQVDYNDLQEVKDTTLNYGNITNCITKIPQDISLVLNNGTLTLKAGSKVYVPNGSGVFKEITVSDNTNTQTLWGIYKYFVVFRENQRIEFVEVNTITSSTTQPEIINGRWWYDTANNKIKTCNGTAWIESNCSLPIALISTADGSTVSSIDQVFNGFGYIGSTVFALPGVEGLIPNGFNNDGSCKNIKYKISEVTCMFNNGYTGLLYLACSDKGKILGYAGPTQDWYNKEKNIIDFTYQNNGKQYWSLIGQCFADDSTHKFTKVSFNRSTTILSIDTPHIVETYHNGTSWYRVYSDGWCEQGGLVSGSRDNTITFFKPFIDTSYSIYGNSIYNSLGSDYELGIVKLSSTQVRIYIDYGGGSWDAKGATWLALGYIS